SVDGLRRQPYCVVACVVELQQIEIFVVETRADKGAIWIARPNPPLAFHGWEIQPLIRILPPAMMREVADAADVGRPEEPNESIGVARSACAGAPPLLMALLPILGDDGQFAEIFLRLRAAPFALDENLPGV